MDAFGEKLAEMYEVQSLGTDPEFQGQGFGSALVTAVTDMVSLRCKPCVKDEY